MGRRRSEVEADFLGTEEGGDLMAYYGSVHPRIGVRLCKSMGFDVDGTPEDFREAGRHIHFVSLRPVRADGSGHFRRLCCGPHTRAP